WGHPSPVCPLVTLAAAGRLQPVLAVRLAALAPGDACALAIVPEVTAVVLLALAVPALAGNLALGLLVHGRETAPGRSPGRPLARFRCRRVVLGAVLIEFVGFVVLHADLLSHLTSDLRRPAVRAS